MNLGWGRTETGRGAEILSLLVKEPVEDCERAAFKHQARNLDTMIFGTLGFCGSYFRVNRPPGWNY